MDSVTAAILAALPGLANETISKAAKDAYSGLKALIVRKWGATAPLAKAITNLEDDPTSSAQAGVVAEKSSQVKAANDSEILAAVDKLMAALDAGLHTKPSSTVTVNMQDSNASGIVGAHTATVGTMNLNAPEPRNR